MERIEQIISRISNWANKRNDIKCIINFGSLSMNTKDQFSDIDIMIFCSNPELLLNDNNWISDISPFKISYTSKSMIESMPTKKVVFSNYVELDIVPINYKEIYKALYFAKIFKTPIYKFIPKTTATEIENNIRAFNNYTSKGLNYFVDKNNYVKKIKYISETFPLINDEIDISMVKENYNSFFHLLIQEAIKIERRELYASKECAEYFSKCNLREMIEWYMKLKKGNDYNTFCNGKKLEYWCEKEVVKEMSNIYGQLNYESCKNSLYSTLQLYNHITLNVLSLLNSDLTKYEETKDFTIKQVNNIFNANRIIKSQN